MHEWIHFIKIGNVKVDNECLKISLQKWKKSIHVCEFPLVFNWCMNNGKYKVTVQKWKKSIHVCEFPFVFNWCMNNGKYKVTVSTFSFYSFFLGCCVRWWAQGQSQEGQWRKHPHPQGRFFVRKLVTKLVIITNFLFNSRNCSFSRFKNIRKKHVLEGVQEWKILYSIVLMFDYPYMNRPPSVQPPWRRSATPSSSTERLPRYS